MLELILLIVRGVQALFSIIVLGLTAHVTDYFGSLDRNSFLLFVSIWTLLALLYLALAPRFAPQIAHSFAVLAVDAVTMIFWFAGFIAEAVLHRDLAANAGYWWFSGCAAIGNTCQTVQAAAVFGGFNWALFVVTTAFAALSVFKRNAKHPPTSGAPAADA